MRATFEFRDCGEIEVATVDSSRGERAEVIAAGVHHFILDRHWRLPLSELEGNQQLGGGAAVVPQSASEGAASIQQIRTPRQARPATDARPLKNLRPKSERAPSPVARC